MPGSRDSDDTNTSGGHSKRINRLLRVIANPHCRQILQYLRKDPEGIASVEELSPHIANHVSETKNAEKAAAALHHHHLPKLADCGLIEYDARTDTIRYRGTKLVNLLLELLEEHAE